MMTKSTASQSCFMKVNAFSHPVFREGQDFMKIPGPPCNTSFRCRGAMLGCWMRYKEEGCWNTPNEKHLGTVVFHIPSDTSKEGIGGRWAWQLSRLSSTNAAMYWTLTYWTSTACSDLYLYTLTTPCRIGAISPILQRRKPGLQKIQLHIQCKLPRTEVTLTGAKLLNVAFLTPRLVILWGGAILCIVGYWAASLALTYQMSVAPPPWIGIAKNASRHWRGGHHLPDWEPLLWNIISPRGGDHVSVLSLFQSGLARSELNT